MNLAKIIIFVTIMIALYGFVLFVPVLRHKEKAERTQIVKEWSKVFLVTWVITILLMYGLTRIF